MSQVRVIQSMKSDPTWFQEKAPVPMQPDEKGQEMELLMVYRDIPYQTVTGFGGALTEASAMNYHDMDESQKQAFLRDCFSPEGLNYNSGRIHIGACDFSRGLYSYCDTPDDTELKTFSIDCDRPYTLPFLQDIKAFRGEELPLLASPWSPPAWMKTNGDMLHGGKLKKEYYGVYAQYIVKFLTAYEKEGLPVERLTIQNEPKAVQIWESCIYTAEEEREFLCEYLRPALDQAGWTGKVLIWDHNKERVYTRVKTILEDPRARKAVGGIAFHWYSGDHFDNLRLVREQYPEFELVFTEGCIELNGGTSMSQKAVGDGGAISTSQSPWEFGECYAYDMIGDFNNGMSGFLDWNVLLDERGGMNHVDNFCGAPLIYDHNEKKLLRQSSYCFIRHMSAYVPAGSRVVAHSCYRGDISVATFLTPEEKLVAVVLNQQEEDVSFVLNDVSNNTLAPITVPGKSITTLIVEE